MDRDTFIRTAKAQMHRALASFSRGDNGMAVLHAGIGDEHLLKAALVHRSPALIVEPRDLSGLLHAAGLGGSAPSPVTSAKTIGAAEAFKRARHVMELPVTEKEHDTLLRARNGMAHMGMHATEETIAAVATAVAVADAVLSDLRLKVSEFWGEYAWSRTDLVELRAGEVRRRQREEESEESERQDQQMTDEWNVARGSVNAKIRYAARLFEARHGIAAMTDPMVVAAWRAEDGVSRALEQVRPWTDNAPPEIGVLPCLVCKHPHAILRGHVRTEGIYPSWDDPDATVQIPKMYDCPACSMELDGYMELLFIGLDGPFNQDDYPFPS
ncbi:hypothetical protein ABZ746_35180 [Streptomyces sp. NPDC020096]